MSEQKNDACMHRKRCLEEAQAKPTPDVNDALDEELRLDAQVYGRRLMSEAGEVCRPCEVILQDMLFPTLMEGRNRKGESRWRDTLIGWLDRLVATRDCKLCQFFLSLVQESEPGGIDTSNFSPTRRYMVRIDNSRVRPSREVRRHWNMTITLDEHVGDDLKRRNVIFWSPRGSTTFSLEKGSMERLAAALPHLDCSGREFGEAVPEYCSPTFIKDAYRMCREVHQEKCSLREGPPDSTGSYLRVIDVQRMSVIPQPKGAEFLALSYCWSSEPFAKLTQANYAEFTMPNGLKNQNLAPTIADAISITAQIGERYLWVDSLCIIQDDAKDKAVQIADMDKVYKMASLTIVAAASDSCRDRGLPSVFPRPRAHPQTAVDVRGLQFVQRLPELGRILDEFHWNTRAWTFQEQWMSRRLLFFTSTQVYFSCAGNCFSEDQSAHFYRLLEKGKELDGHGFSDRRERKPTDPMWNSNVDELGAHGLATLYTSRKMSYDSDALNAVKGLLNVVTRNTGIRFLCGIPASQFFQYYISWVQVSSFERERGPTTSGQAFPSWSWLGWVGEITWGGDKSWSKPEEQWGEQERYTVVQDWQIESPNVNNNKPIHIQHLDDMQLSSIETCTLVFRTEHAVLQITKDTVGDLGRRSGGPNRAHGILINNHYSGLMIPNLVLQPDADEASYCIQCISLSKYAFWNVGVLIKSFGLEKDAWQNNVDDEEPTVNKIFDDRVWSDEYPTPCFAIMWIKWKGGVAYRCGIGIVHGDAWRCAGPTTIDVRLG